MRTRSAIVGYGVVGKAMNALLPEAVVYDTAPGHPSDRSAVNNCDIAFVCVPTPARLTGQCDISVVVESVAWLETPLIVLRSTVLPGTTNNLMAESGKHIVFQPEYLGETVGHPYSDPKGRQFVVLGGDPADCSQVADFYMSVYNSTVRFHFTDSTTAELAKYMENAFFAAKILFCTEFRRITEAMGIQYPRLREIWLADSRISPDHTFAFPSDLGFAGKCLPKDLLAIIDFARQLGCDPTLLQAIHDINEKYRADVVVTSYVTSQQTTTIPQDKERNMPRSVDAGEYGAAPLSQE